MLESFVLVILEKVLGDYISSVMTRQSRERTRAEVTQEIRREVRNLGEIQDDVAAIGIAVRELDLIVKGDATLDWSGPGDVLVLRPRRKGVLRKPFTTDDALTDLRNSIAERRAELQTPVHTRTAQDKASDDNDMETDVQQEDRDIVADVTLATSHSEHTDLILAPDKSKASDPPIPWRERVISLPMETVRERQRRVADDNQRVADDYQEDI
jgi:hypothetical protein